MSDDKVWINGQPIGSGALVPALWSEQVLAALAASPIGPRLPPEPPKPWHRRIRRRARSWWAAHRPTLHLGPCDHSECDW